MVTIVFKRSYATPIIRLLIGVISDLKVTCNYLSDFIEILYSDHLNDDGKYNDGFYLSNFLCLAYNKAINLDKLFRTKQLRNGEYNSDNYFSNF